ncbi:MAG: NAD-dependent epimerase/dehydratase family protein [Rhodospirillales bacterium]
MSAAGARERFLITGGAGFIGSHFVDFLLGAPGTARVTVYDNFTSGRRWHLEAHANDARLEVVHADIHERDRLADAASGHDVVIHLASNPDIARSANEPDLDFDEGTVLVRNVLEAMRIGDCRTILYVSGSGVYGDLGETEAVESTVDIRPVSTYGAGKLAGEGLIAAYAHMFGFRGYSFRLGNVVGARQTHGVGFDFIRKLKARPGVLDILGDGSQSKSYVHVGDVVAGMMHVLDHAGDSYDVFNLASGNYITVREIADMAIACLGLDDEEVQRRYGDGPRGWRGDVPVIRLNTDKIRKLGWSPRHGSGDAMRLAIEAMLAEPRCWQE